jgi:membrane-associated phospholipid phosphatase
MSKSKSLLPVKGKALFYWLIAILIVVAAIVAAFRFDIAVANFMANHQTPGLRDFMRNVSRFGDWWEHFLVGLACAGIAWRRGSKRWTRIFLAMLIALSIAGLTGRAIKISTARARPSVKSEQAWLNPQHWSSKYHSFPSGHVDASVAFFAVLAFASWRTGLPLFVIPVLIGFSRMYLGAHYLSDVVCAAVLGILSAILVTHFFLRRTAEIRPAAAQES